MPQTLEVRKPAIQRTPVRQLVSDLTELSLNEALDQLSTFNAKGREQAFQKMFLLAFRQNLEDTLAVLDVSPVEKKEPVDV